MQDRRILTSSTKDELLAAGYKQASDLQQGDRVYGYVLKTLGFTETANCSITLAASNNTYIDKIVISAIQTYSPRSENSYSYAYSSNTSNISFYVKNLPQSYCWIKFPIYGNSYKTLGAFGPASTCATRNTPPTNCVYGVPGYYSGLVHLPCFDVCYSSSNNQSYQPYYICSSATQGIVGEGQVSSSTYSVDIRIVLPS